MQPWILSNNKTQMVSTIQKYGKTKDSHTRHQTDRKKPNWTAQPHGKERDVETVGLCLPCQPTNSPPSPGEDRKKNKK